MLFMACVCHAFSSVHGCLVVTCWERADHLALFVKFNCVIVPPGSGVVLDCIDSWSLPPFSPSIKCVLFYLLLLWLFYGLIQSLTRRINTIITRKIFRHISRNVGLKAVLAEIKV